MTICRSIRSIIWQRRFRHSFITTPIFYANSAPHIGHLYSAVIADAAHRWEILKAPNELHQFTTGTDEHGSKIERAATSASLTPIEHCDKVTAQFRALFEAFDISYTDYIRTTEERHKRAVREFWARLSKAGHLYKGKYSGWYSVIDECFYKDSEVEKIRSLDGKESSVAKETRNPVEWVDEENYMFRLSDFKEKTKKILESTEVITPTHFKPLAIRELDACGDLSVSRDSTRLKWGIPVPDDPSQRVYVWLDALINYLTVNGFPDKMQFPAPTCQIIGKDILRFHTAYWFAFLQALNLPLPERLFVHGHWLVNNVKMSKSLGNVVDPMEIAGLLSNDGLRYFLLKQGVPTDDCNFMKLKAIELINSDLVNTIGNLLQRSTIPKLNPAQVYPIFDAKKVPSNCAQLAKELINDLGTLSNRVRTHYDELYFYRGIEILLNIVRKTNAFFQEAQPWKLSDQEEILTVLAVSYETLRITAILLSPIVPKFSAHTLSRLSIKPNEANLQEAHFRGIGCFGGKLGSEKEPFLNRIKPNN
ncbi:unnamed protein product, partial [Mesorhabditis belari]|uniref:Methionine--tRNA ligase, mitochondrial n=1 Tax=Mesorhabditis belari TaxID=2138241 RepID=A0AAF3J385_9BILA